MRTKLQYEWPNLDEQSLPLVEAFERDLLPYLEKHGPYIGELAMAGWKVAEEIMLRHQGFVHGAPEARRYNLAMLMAALSIWKEKWEDVKAGVLSVAESEPRVLH